MYYTTQRNQLYINQSNQRNNVMSRRKRNQPIYHFNKITILIRNTYRPNTFSKCIQSVLMQEYTNYRIIMCYDDDRCMEYLEEYRNHNKIELFKVKRESEASHFDNLYCNHLLDRVRDGWILFLDDDNMLSQPDTLKKINNNIKTENDIIFWKVKLGEHIIYPNIYDIKYGQIDSAGFCFHSKYKNAARWIAEQGSDFHYVTQLLKKHYLIRRAHSEILTQSVLTTKIKLLDQKKSIYCILEGGLGNQLFIIFNIISLSKEYDLNFNLEYDPNYTKKYNKEHKVIRKSGKNYNLLKFIKFKNFNLNTIKYNTINEPEYKYNKIYLNNNSFLIKGYYQSYKYFWNNIDYIKTKINVENIYQTLNNIQFTKPILSIHVRLGDYLHNTEFHNILPIEYYKQALSFYKLENYKIILFSDDINKAIDLLNPLNIDYITADSITTNDEEQFNLLCISYIRICANSSFSLMSCYLNEMFLFVNDCEYLFPHKWFGPKGPKHNTNDLMLNYKFITIDYDNIITNKKYNVATTLHIKDKERYTQFLKYNTKRLPDANKYYYISYQKYDINAEYISENEYPFTKKEVINYIKNYIPNYRWGWYYQQLLKLYIFRINKIKSEYILIFDSDILLLKNIVLFENETPLLFKRNTGDKKIHKPYKECIKDLLKNLNDKDIDSGICHFMLFKKEYIEKLLITIEQIHNKPAWQACLDSVINYIKLSSYDNSIFSEYELYYNYIKTYKKNVYKINKNLLYEDINLKELDIINNNYQFIADHHYQSRESEDYKIDNLIEENIIVIKNFGENALSYNLFNDLINQIENIFTNYNCNISKDRIKIINKNTKINNLLKTNNSITNIDYCNFYDIILKKNYLDNNLRYSDYSKYNMFHNKKGNLKNHILLYIDNNEFLDEIILNINYTIISDNLPEYKYTILTKKYQGKETEIEYIIYDNSTLLNVLEIIKIDTNKSERLDIFLSKKIPLLQICIPNFNNLPQNLINHYNSWNINFFWNIKFDKYLSEKFIKNNFHYYLYLCYSLIYSVTAQTDLIRHLFLYKFSGCYFDLSIKLINTDFLKLINESDFITSRDENHDSLQNGILFIKNKKSNISEKFILEILSGVINYNTNTNNKTSKFYNYNPSHSPFFYGPTTLFKIYNEIKDNLKCKILNTYFKKKIVINNNHWEFKAISKDTNNQKEYLQVKYIGYNKDIRNSTNNKHYSENWYNNLHFNSPLNYFDKILIINLKHREDRKKEMLEQLNRFNINKDKVIFIDAIYNKENGALGCTASHIKCLEYSIKNDLDNVIILEDDYNFIKQIDLFNNELIKFLIYNINWDVLLLNMSEHGPPINIKINIDNVYLNLWSHSAAAYILKKSIFKDRLINLKKSLYSGLGPHDFHWNNLKIKYNWYVIKNILGSQRASYSDIEKKKENIIDNTENILENCF